MNVTANKGYDNTRVIDEVRERCAAPIICLCKGRPIPLTPIPYGSAEWNRLYLRPFHVRQRDTRLSPLLPCQVEPRASPHDDHLSVVVNVGKQRAVIKARQTHDVLRHAHDGLPTSADT